MDGWFLSDPMMKTWLLGIRCQQFLTFRITLVLFNCSLCMKYHKPRLWWWKFQRRTSRWNQAVDPERKHAGLLAWDSIPKGWRGWHPSSASIKQFNRTLSDSLRSRGMSPSVLLNTNIYTAHFVPWTLASLIQYFLKSFLFIYFYLISGRLRMSTFRKTDMERIFGSITLNITVVK